MVVPAVFLLFSACVSLVNGHEYFPGQCPNFTPMSGFNWDKFSSGLWYVTQKFATRSSCLTYEFKTDELGFKSIEQVRQLPYTDKLPLEHEYIYTGKLYAPQESSPAKMIVRFPLSINTWFSLEYAFEINSILDVVGSSSFIVLDTDYDSYGLICTCQDMDLYFTYAHRLSCSILQRDSVENAEITKRMRDLVDSQVEDASHDFDKIKQEGCDYNKERVLNIDVDKILGLKGDSSLREAVESVASEFEFSKKSLKDIQDEAKNNL